MSLQQAIQERLESQVAALETAYKLRMARLARKAAILEWIDRTEAQFLRAAADAVRSARRATAKMDLHSSAFIPLRDLEATIRAKADHARLMVRRARGTWTLNTGDAQHEDQSD